MASPVEALAVTPLIETHEDHEDTVEPQESATKAVPEEEEVSSEALPQESSSEAKPEEGSPKTAPDESLPLCEPQEDVGTVNKLGEDAAGSQSSGSVAKERNSSAKAASEGSDEDNETLNVECCSFSPAEQESVQSHRSPSSEEPPVEVSEDREGEPLLS